MLGSITPLGERSRRMRWGITVGWLAGGAALGGAVAAGGLGFLGGLARVGSAPVAAREWALAMVAFGAAALDITRRIPTIHRQVNDSWLYVYRGWAYGFGFGTQLGIGAATVVTTAGTYAAFLAALLVASPAAGVIGAMFGVARAVPLLTTASVSDLPALVRVERRLRDAEALARWLAIGVYATLGAALLGGVVV